MITKEKKRRLRSVLAMAASAVTIASVTVPVSGTPDTKGLEITTPAFKGEGKNLDSQLSSLSAELDSTSAQIEDLSAEIEKAKLDLVAARLNEETHYNAMKSRIKFMYEGGSLSLLEIMFTSEDMGDFLNKAEYVSIIGEYDRTMLRELSNIRSSVEKKQNDLTAKQEELSAMQADLNAKTDALISRISAGRGGNYAAQLERAKAAANAGNQAQNNETLASASSVELVLFAALLECEAYGYDSMLAVATVIMNRIASPDYPNTIKSVIYQSGQFSPTWNGSMDKALAKGPSSTAYAVAQAALNGARHSTVSHCYQFRASFTGVSGINVGGNIFF